MPLWPNFCAGAYRSRSGAIAASTAKNVFLESTASNAEAKGQTLYGTPGLRPLTTVATAGCRGAFAQDSVTLTVVGTDVYSVDTSIGAAAKVGSIADDGKPVSMSSNGRGGEQVAIVSAGFLYVYSITAGTITGPVATPNTNGLVLVEYVDGYFLANERDTIRVWFSAIENALLWDALDFFARSQTSDNVVGIKALHNRLLVLGSQTGDVYYDSGDADTPFQPYPGSVIQEGLTSPYAIGVLGEQAVWLAQDNQGKNRVVVGSDNAVPQRVSTPAIEFLIAQYAGQENAEILCYEQEGHAFACLTFGDDDQTVCVDAAENWAWHQRNEWHLDGTETRWRARGLCSTPSGLLVGDYDTGELYLLDLGYSYDGTRNIKRERQAPYPSAENQWMFLDQVELGMEPGVGTIDVPLPAVRLEISRDNAKTFEDAGTAGLGAAGEYDTRAIWTMLGRVRADRLSLRLSMTDAVPCVWGPGLWLRFSPGTGQL